MDRPSHVHPLLEKVTAILPVSDEDLVYKGIAAGVSERIIDLNKAVIEKLRASGLFKGGKHEVSPVRT